LMSERTAETRLELRKFLLQNENNSTWRNRVIDNVFSAFVLLVRKNDGWKDIDDALARIDNLRELQKEHEDGYIDSQENTSKQTIAAIELVGLYHLAQLITLVGDYLKDGENRTRVRTQIDRHHENSVSSFETARSPLL